VGLDAFAGSYQRLRPYLDNSGWILAERLVALGLGLFASVLVARYLGPEDFGTLAYAISLVALFGMSGHLGLHGLVVREFVKRRDHWAETAGTTAALKLIGVIVGYIALLMYGAVFEGAGSQAFQLIAIAGAALLFAPSDVVDYWFNAFLQARYVAIARISSQLLFFAIVALLVSMEASLVSFGWPYLVQGMISAAALLLTFRLRATFSLAEWHFSASYARQVLRQGGMIYVGSLLAIIYLKVDQVMLRWLSDSSEVGVYAVAARISEVWYFVPTAIVASAFPKLIELRETGSAGYTRRLQQLFDALAILGMAVAVAVTFLAPWFLPWLFGDEYAGAVNILIVHTWASVFVFMRAAFSRWILIEDALSFSVLTQGLGALSNVLLNFTLIPFFAGQGAAWATLISYAIASFFAVACHRKTRPVFWLMSKALVAPVRYSIRLVTGR